MKDLGLPGAGVGQVWASATFEDGPEVTTAYALLLADTLKCGTVAWEGGGGGIKATELEPKRLP